MLCNSIFARADAAFPLFGLRSCANETRIASVVDRYWFQNPWRNLFATLFHSLEAARHNLGWRRSLEDRNSFCGSHAKSPIEIAYCTFQVFIYESCLPASVKVNSFAMKLNRLREICDCEFNLQITNLNISTIAVRLGDRAIARDCLSVNLLGRPEVINRAIEITFYQHFFCAKLRAHIPRPFLRSPIQKLFNNI